LAPSSEWVGAPRADDVAAITELLVIVAPLSERESRIVEYLGRFEQTSTAIVTALLGTVDGGGSDELVARLVGLLDGPMWSLSFQAICRLTSDTAREAALNAFARDTERLKRRARDLGPLIDPSTAREFRERLQGTGREDLYLRILARASQETVSSEQHAAVDVVKRLLSDPKSPNFNAALEFIAMRGPDLRDEELLGILEKLAGDSLGQQQTKALRIALQRLRQAAEKE
jgi:hypothetical protein